MRIFGGVIENLIYRKGLPCMVLSIGADKFNVYLNPRIKPEVNEPLGKEFLLIEGEFLPQDENTFSPNLIVEWNENGFIDHQLCFD